jgi:hypothetical protein
VKKTYITILAISLLVPSYAQPGELLIIDGNGEFIGILIASTHIADSYQVRNNQGYIFNVTAKGGPETADPLTAIYLNNDCTGQPYLHTHVYDITRHIYPVIDNSELKTALYFVPDNPDYIDAGSMTYSYYDRWSGICAIVYPPTISYNQPMMVIEIIQNNSKVTGVRNQYAAPVHPDYLPYSLISRQY